LRNRSIAEKQGKDGSIMDVNNDAENAGITSMEVRKHSIKAYVKNFNPVSKQINLKLLQNGKEISESGKIDVLPNSVETFIFDDTPAGISQIRLEPDDDLDVNNIAYISAPLKKQVNVLLITNRHDTNLENALLALIKDAGKRQAMGANGFTRVKQEFSMEKMVRKYEELFNPGSLS